MLIIYRFLIFALVILGCLHPLEATPDSKISLSHLHRFTRFPKDYQTAVRLLQQLPEVSALLAKINQEGGVAIEKHEDPTSAFDAYWDGKRRVILVSDQHNQDVGTCICSILFELHNAKTNKLFLSLVDQAKKGLISKEDYVKNVEQMEYQNALDTVKVLEKGIQKGVFPSKARWNIYYQFDDYYKAQQLMGHSGWLAQSYDTLNADGYRQSFQGTIVNLHLMTDHDKRKMLYYLSIKNHLSSFSEAEIALAKFQLEDEFRSLKHCICDSQKNGIPKIQLMQMVFQGQHEYEKLKKSYEPFPLLGFI